MTMNRMKNQASRRWRVGAAALACVMGMAWGGAQANEEFKRPDIDPAQVPAVEPGWAEVNPLRGNAQAIAVGRNAFNQTCARCHGPDGDGSRSPAPDLRRIGGVCQKIKDSALQTRCFSDADYFFVKSVRYGKEKFGIVHMPPWDGILEPGLIWSIRSFLETAR